MNKFDFTQGEWRYSEKFLNVFCIENQGNICELDTERDIKEDIANARLISKAPEMLNALIELLKKGYTLITQPHIKNSKYFEQYHNEFIKTYQKEINIIESATGKKWEDIV